MPGRTEQRLAGVLLNDPAIVHHADPVGDPTHQVEIVTDQQDRHAQPSLQALQQLQEAFLHGDVESRGRFVGDQQLRLAGQRHGQHHPLPLAAGELVRIGLEQTSRLFQAGQFEQFQHPLAQRGATQATMQAQALADLAYDALQWIERGHRLLEHHADALPTNRQQCLRRQGEQFLAVQAHAAAQARRARQQAQQGVGGLRLAGAGLADQGQGLAGAQAEVDPLHDLRVAIGDAQVFHSQQFPVHLMSSDRRRRAPLRR